MKSSFSFSLNPETSASVHDEGIVILHLGKGQVFSANKTGALIWRGIEERHSIDEIAENISGEFQITPATARQHALDFLATLEQQTLIRKEVV